MFEILWLIALMLELSEGFSPMWWSSVAQLSAHQPTGPLHTDPSALGTVCSQLTGLSPGQSRVCELFSDHMPAVGHGAKLAIDECQAQFSTRLWNCSTPQHDVVGPVHELGSREAAFTYAILSAGVTHEVSRTCRMGHLSTCGCSKDSRPNNLEQEWIWGGCGDNIQYGYKFGRNFIDVREKEKLLEPSSPDYARSLMNRWNNEVGRKIVRRESDTKCKCHGVSGSCNLKTCWTSLAKLNDVAAKLAEKYEDAVRVKINKRGNLQQIGRRNKKMKQGKGRRRRRTSMTDLVFLDKSPDYCEPNPTLGIPGTRGRECEKYGHGMHSCDKLCCGRGYNTHIEVLSEKCNCKFQWCCSVVCKRCKTQITRHTCK